jgi:hypothetical protein
MFDYPIDKDPQTLEESFDNLDVLNRRLVVKLNEQGLDHRFEPMPLKRSRFMGGGR